MKIKSLNRGDLTKIKITKIFTQSQEAIDLIR